jgi:hypothetical protein
MTLLGRLTFSLALLVALAISTTPSAHAQDGDDMDQPTIDFAVKAMQGAQFLRTDFDVPEGSEEPRSDQGEVGFDRVRFNLEVSAQLHERISLFVDLGHEPNDFGTGGNSFSPAVDYVALDLMLNEAFTLRLGTPVTGPFNFRGYSDGAATQGNPVIGNSPIDFITAQTGVALIGDPEGPFGFDVTVTTPTFFQTFEPGTGLSLIGKAKYATETFGVGAAVMKVTSQPRSGVATSWIRGDGENYTLAGMGGGQPNRYTHAYLNPGFSPLVLHADAMVKAGLVEADFWGGISTEQYSFGIDSETPVPNPRVASNIIEEDSQMLFAGATVKLNATESFHVAGRVSYADNTSDWAADDETSLLRIQAGVGYTFWEKVMWKLEFVSQDEGVNSPGQIGDNWYGVSTELSFQF